MEESVEPAPSEPSVVAASSICPKRKLPSPGLESAGGATHMGGKKAAAFSSAVEHRLAHIEEMTIDQISKLLWDSSDDFNAGKITAKESGVLTKAANKRLRAIKRELRTANELIGD
jgi:hypothetical protein